MIEIPVWVLVVMAFIVLIIKKLESNELGGYSAWRKRISRYYKDSQWCLNKPIEPV